MLVGRAREVATLERVVNRARSGVGSVIVLRGEPGMGKSALLEHVGELSDGCRVARTAGVRSEMELPYSGLQQLCSALPKRYDRLPGPQAAALRAAFGLVAGGPADPFLVGLAALSLIVEVARKQPVICLIDDAQWLDRASAQAFTVAARRLEGPIALIFASRPVDEVDPLDGLPELNISSLSTTAARMMLATAVTGQLDPAVTDRIIAECRGNPLALLELSSAITLDALAGGFGPGTRGPIQGRLQAAFTSRLTQLPTQSRLLLILAAAEPIGDPGLLWRAAERLNIPRDALDAAEDAGLISVGAKVAFRHPLVRSAVYDSATPTQRRRVHTALAQATDPDLDPDRRAWHMAAGTRGPDETVALELEQSAGRAQSRGGYYAASAFLERAMELSTDPADRSRRALAAARLKELAGATDAVTRLLTLAESGPLDAEARARARRLRGRGAFATNRAGQAARLLLEAARELQNFDPEAAQETYLEALSAALFASKGRGDDAPASVARAALSAPRPTTGSRPADLLLDAVAALVAEGSAAAAPRLRQALRSFTDADVRPETQLRWMWLASRMAVLIWDDQTWRSLVVRASAVARDAGAYTALTAALSSQMALEVLTGNLAVADVLADEAEVVSIATGIAALPYGPVVIGAWRGRSPDIDELLESSLTAVTDRGEGMGVALVHWARALLYNSHGRYAEALNEGRESIVYPPAMLYSQWGLIETIEAATRCGDHATAAATFKRFATSTRSSETDWAAGMEARCKALLADGATAEGCYQEAIHRLGRTPMVADLARAELLYGEWLRRARRRAEARQHLRTAMALFGEMGAEAFTERARRELVATGVTARRRTVDTQNDLSPQEARIAGLASQGLSNQEIANQMFISVNTVDYHLRKVFRKLAVTSRSQLHLALPKAADPSR